MYERAYMEPAFDNNTLRLTLEGLRADLEKNGTRMEDPTFHVAIELAPGSAPLSARVVRAMSLGDVEPITLYFNGS